MHSLLSILNEVEAFAVAKKGTLFVALLLFLISASIASCGIIP